MTSRNESRAQVDPALLEQFMRQQEAKYTSAPPVAPTPAPGAYSVPTDFVELPSKGVMYPEGHPWHMKDKVEVRFMTTKEEDILTSPAYAKAGVTFDKLIENITVDKINVDTLLIGDKNALIVNARKNAYGSEYEFFIMCANCIEGHELTANLEHAEIKDLSNVTYDRNTDGTYSVKLPQSQDLINFRLFTGKDEKYMCEQQEIRKKHNLKVENVVALHRQALVSVNGSNDASYIEQYIQKMLIRDSRFLQKVYQEVRPDISIKYSFNCKECGHKNEGGVPFGADFFWPDD